MSFIPLTKPLREPPGALLGGIRESLMASLALSVDDDDSKFIDVVDYLLSPDRDACVSDRVIQKYLTLNPQAKEHLVEMLKQLATANVEDHRFADAIESTSNSTLNEENGDSVDTRKDSKAPRIAFVRVVGATPKAVQRLQVCVNIGDVNESMYFVWMITNIICILYSLRSFTLTYYRTIFAFRYRTEQWTVCPF